MGRVHAYHEERDKNDYGAAVAAAAAEFSIFQVQLA